MARPLKLKQHAPIAFGEAFNPKSVDGVRLARQKRAEARRWKQMEADCVAAIEAAKPLRLVLWDKLRSLTGLSK